VEKFENVLHFSQGGVIKFKNCIYKVTADFENAEYFAGKLLYGPFQGIF
jgi:hypothetical protein